MPYRRILVRLLLGFVLFITGYGEAKSMPGIDTLLQQLEHEESLSQRADIMLDIARQYQYSDLSQTIHFADQACNLYKKTDDTRGMAKSMTILGGGYFALGEYSIAETWFNDALTLAREDNDILQTAKILNNLAGVKLNTGQMEEAIDYFLQAAEGFEQTDYTEGAIAVENSVSVLYQKVGSYRKAHEHLEKAIALAAKIRDERQLGILYYNLANLLSEEGEYNKALEAATESFDIRNKTGARTGKVKTLLILGSIYYELGQIQASDTCYKKALTLAVEYELKEEKAYILMHYGYLNMERGEYASASEYLYESLDLANELSDPVLKQQLYSYLFKTDSAMGDFQSAMLHLQQFNHLKNSWEINTASERLEELEGLFMLAKSENAKKDRIIRFNRTLIICLVAGILMLVMITILIIQQLLLRSQRKIADLTQENLRSQMNPHFIFNILNSIHSYILKNDINSSGNYLKLFAGFLRRTLDNADSKLSTVQDELDALKIYLELESMRFNNRLEYEIIVDDEIDPLMFRIPTFLLQPYVENSIIHGLQNKQGKGKIEIRLEYRDHGIQCSIEDNGIGREKAAAIRRRREPEHISRGSQITESRIRLLNKIYGRKFSVISSDILDENQECRGTKVEFKLPVLN